MRGEGPQEEPAMCDWGALTSGHLGICFYEQIVMDGRGDSTGLVSAGQKVPSQ